MPYMPDPKQVRAIATRIIRSEIDSIRDLGAMDIGEQCEDEIGALYESDMTTHEANDASDVLIDAVRKEISAAAISSTWATAEVSPLIVGADGGYLVVECSRCGMNDRWKTALTLAEVAVVHDCPKDAA